MKLLFILCLAWLTLGCKSEKEKQADRQLEQFMYYNRYVHIYENLAICAQHDGKTDSIDYYGRKWQAYIDSEKMVIDLGLRDIHNWCNCK